MAGSGSALSAGSRPGSPGGWRRCSRWSGRAAIELGGAGRGIAFRLVEQLGTLRREEAESLLGILRTADRRALGRLGVRFGLHHLYLPDLLKPAANEARARLLRVFHGRTIALPPPGRTVLRPATADLLALGYADFGTFALRVDILERIAARISAEARAGATFEISPALAAEAGLARGELGRSDGSFGLSAGDRCRPGGLHPARP